MEDKIKTLIDGEGNAVVKESVKLVKNTRGYGWEIRLLPFMSDIWTEADTKRLKQINDQLIKEYGTTEED